MHWISLPFEQGVNSYASPELSFEFHYFLFENYSLSLCGNCVSGGYGTMDELFEALTQFRPGNERNPIYLYGKEFWSPLINFNQFLIGGVISPEDQIYFSYR